MEVRKLVFFLCAGVILPMTPSFAVPDVCTAQGIGYGGLCPSCPGTVSVTAAFLPDCDGCEYEYAVPISCPGMAPTLEEGGGVLNCGTNKEKRYHVPGSGCEPPAVAAWVVDCANCPEQ